MKKLFLVFMLILSTLVFAEKDTFVVGMELEYPPFETIDNNGNPSGVSVELAKYLSESLGKDVRIENISYPGLIPALLSGKIDAIISSMTINEQRAKKVDFSIPYASSPLVLLAYKDSSVTSPADINSNNVTVAVKSGTIGALWVDSNAPDANVRIFDKESQAVLDVAQGKSDALIYDPLSVIRYNKRYPETTRPIMTPLPGVSGWGIAIRKGQPELLDQINYFITTSKTDGTFDKIRNEYLKEKAAKFESETGMDFFF